MRIINLGCGTKGSPSNAVVNIDWSIYFRIKKSRLLSRAASLLIRGERLNRFKMLPDNIIVHNLKKGIPFADNSVDVVYHSHLLEHMDKEVAVKFLLEVKRVLKPGGIQRIVVPDLEKACRAYLEHISICENEEKECANHDQYVAALIEQSVRREAFGTSQQDRFRRGLENLLLGDARKRGETHQWMYDRINMKILLTGMGFQHFKQQTFTTSIIRNWNEYVLDTDEHGNEHIAGSLYIEVQK